MIRLHRIHTVGLLDVWKTLPWFCTERIA